MFQAEQLHAPKVNLNLMTLTYEYQPVWSESLKQDTSRRRVSVKTVLGGSESPARWFYGYSLATFGENGFFIGHREVDLIAVGSTPEWRSYRFNVTADDPARGSLERMQILADSVNVLQTVHYTYDPEEDSPVPGVDIVWLKKTESCPSQECTYENSVITVYTYHDKYGTVEAADVKMNGVL